MNITAEHIEYIVKSPVFMVEFQNRLASWNAAGLNGKQIQDKAHNYFYGLFEYWGGDFMVHISQSGDLASSIGAKQIDKGYKWHICFNEYLTEVYVVDDGAAYDIAEKSGKDYAGGFYIEKAFKDDKYPDLLFCITTCIKKGDINENLSNTEVQEA